MADEETEHLIADWQLWGNVLRKKLLIVESDGSLREPFGTAFPLQVLDPEIPDVEAFLAQRSRVSQTPRTAAAGGGGRRSPSTRRRTRRC